MIGPRAIVGLSLLCTLAFCAFASSSAFAAKGTTAFICAKAEKGEFTDAHCTKSGAGVGYKHEAIAVGTKTNIVISNKNTKNETKEATPAVLKFKIPPMDGEFICQTVSGEGSLTNNAGPPMNVSGEVAITYSECVFQAGGTFPGCELEGSSISTKATLSTPTEEMAVKFSDAGEVFTKFRLTKCKTEAFNIEYVVKGSYSAIPSGTTWETTAVSTKGLSTAGGQAALETKTTVTMSATETGIALTTTES
jgi:hypothetical protein